MSQPEALVPQPVAGQSGNRSRLDQFERLLDRLSENLNPILIKESRQAMKSKQFVVTFSLLLICGWGWSFLGVALMSPAIYYAPGGRFMLLGYYFVLAFPLVVIVPFSAFRSLASEREDGTYELLCISTLRPGQIVAGKLGSAMLQMLVYLSVLSPCIAFTYLLRGIDILLIVLFLYYAVLVSLYLANAGLLLATVTKARHWQAVLAVLTILGLLGLFIFASALITEMITRSGMLPVDEPEFWIGQGMFLTFYATTFVLMFLASSAQLTFKSDNRSTRLRIAMLAQYVLFAGWMARYWTLFPNEEELLVVFVVISTIHWYLMGLFMTGENANLSPRVRRKLPQTFLGRVFLTWFYPGPTSGYLFATASMFSVLVLVAVAQSASIFAGTLRSMGLNGAAEVARQARWDDEPTLAAVVMTCYLVIYLGLGRLILRLLSRSVQPSIVLSLVVHLCLLVFGIFVPMVVQFSLIGILNSADDYTIMQTPNVIWTFVAILERDFEPAVLFFLIPASLVLLMVNVFVGAREIVPARTSIPKRVAEAIGGEKGDQTASRTSRSPWDDARIDAPSAQPSDLSRKSIS